MKRFNDAKYNIDQICDALLCPLNRHYTRIEHNCNDWDLYRHPEWLLEHYIANGGAVRFAKHREEKEYWIEKEEEYQQQQTSSPAP